MTTQTAHRSERLELRQPGQRSELPAARARRRAARATLLPLAEAFAYASGLAALVGFSVTFAVARALRDPRPIHSAALVASSAFFIYTLDRLRDGARDADASPRRSAFIARHRRPLAAATGLAAVAVAALFLGSDPRVALLALPIGAVGLLHRRLKRSFAGKILYVSGAWATACVGIPWLASVGAGAQAGVSGVSDARTAICAGVIVAAGLLANVIASNLRSGKLERVGFESARQVQTNALAVAGLVALAGVGAASIAPASVATLAFIPASMALAIGFFRASERYAHLVLDGALAIGAGLAIACAAGLA